MKKYAKFTAAALAAIITASCAATAASAKTIIPSGDFDRDGTLTSNDAVSVLRCSVGAASGSNVAVGRSDVDRDGELSSNDAVTILRRSVGEEAEQVNDDTYSVNDGLNDFSAEIFKRCYESGENTLVSPLSVYTALSMLENGADGETREEMLNLLGGGTNSVDDINSYINRYITNINSGDTLRTANAMFVMQRDDIIMNEDFKNKIRTDYFAEIFSEPANNDTVDKINGWVKDNTNNLIDSIVPKDSLTPDKVAILLNAVTFKAEWDEQYEDFQIKKDTFHNYSGKDSTVDFLCGTENEYLSDELSIGFMKAYKPTWVHNDDYSNWEKTEDYRFLAILPNEGVTVDEYIAQMDDATIRELVDSRTYDADVRTKMPKFKFDCTYGMEDMLSDMGMRSAFSPSDADFSKFAKSTVGNNIYVDSVTHKTYINLDENGTEAAAVTAIVMADCDVEFREKFVEITLDRPFIYVIYDMKNNIPVFIGTVCEL